ncbi:MAG: UvrD-helicase domain-containing protein [Alphaproteobacteria bacterium]|nr:UvrD-helicase domain-containing protein [Alphaproteobacteria bacterium]
MTQPLAHQPASAEPPYLRGLNEEQREAVLALDGPVLVLAGAGTGKTRVLTTRLAHLIASRKAWPSQILSVTFTNKAAREMIERTGALVGGMVEGMPWLGTFHSICAKILRRHAELVGLKPSFSILDVDDQLRLLKQVIEAARIDEKRWPARHLSSLIDSWKNRAMSPKDVPPGESFAYGNGKGAELYEAYQQRLKSLNAVDFGDLLLDVITILKTHPQVLQEYQDRFVYILVDEYQDTNVAQYLWLRLLAGQRRNICCVGDDDQSIYGWRGAEVDNILRFERDFPGAKIVRLERNYRSTPYILAAASGLIAANKSRLGKTLWTDAPEGDRVSVRGVWDAQEEARIVADDIEQKVRNREKLSHVAILVRASFQMRAFEERFVQLGIPYRVVGGPRFYERQEIRDALAYLRVIVQPDDDLAFERIFNKPKRGLGDAALQSVHKMARAMKVPLFAAARAMIETDELPARTRSALRDLVQSFIRWADQATALSHIELAEMVLDESGYTAMWQTDRSPEAPGRLENLNEFVQSMKEFDSLGGFLEHVSLVMEIEQSESTEKVTIMTLHGAKGLEFPTVFLPGWEEGVFPSQRTLDENGLQGLEEERRLAYVGLTRARETAKISYAANRSIHGRWQSSMPSRFIAELPADAITVESDPGMPYGGQSNLSTAPIFDSGYSSPGWQRAQARRGEVFGSRPAIEGQAELVATSDPAAETFRRGERVFHQKFGYGRVTALDGNKLTVNFDKAGEKRVIASYLARA